MSLFTKKNLSKEKQDEYNKLDKERDEVQKLFEKESEGTKEKGDYLLKYIALSKKMHLIKNQAGNKFGVELMEGMYKAGLRQGKWKK